MRPQLKLMRETLHHSITMNQISNIADELAPVNSGPLP